MSGKKILTAEVRHNQPTCANLSQTGKLVEAELSNQLTKLPTDILHLTV